MPNLRKEEPQGSSVLILEVSLRNHISAQVLCGPTAPHLGELQAAEPWGSGALRPKDPWPYGS